MKNKSGLVKSFGILQVFILVVGVVAMSWMMGVGFGENSIGRKALLSVPLGRWGIVGEKAGEFLEGEIVGVVEGKFSIRFGPPKTPTASVNPVISSGSASVPTSVSTAVASPTATASVSQTITITEEMVKKQVPFTVGQKIKWEQSFNEGGALITKVDGTTINAERAMEWSKAIGANNQPLQLAQQDALFKSSRFLNDFSTGDEIGGYLNNYEGINLKVESVINKADGTTTLKLNNGAEYTAKSTESLGDVAKATATQTTTGTGSKFGDALQKWGLSNQGAANFLGHLGEGVMWGATIGGIVSMVAGFIGPENSNIGTASFLSILGGASVGKGVYGLIKEGGWSNKFFGFDGGKTQAWMGPKGWSTIIGIGVAAAIFYWMYKEESQQIVTYTCNPWEAPTGGSNCEMCNEMFSKYGVPCSEYQCKSLGQACQLENSGTGEEICVWVDVKDVEYPTIEIWKEALSDDHSSVPDKAISPPDRGVIIKYDLSTSGKIKPFTPLSFGITLNEPAACKIDIQRKDKYEDMAWFFGGSSTLKYNHTQTMSLPGPSALRAANLTVQNGGEYEIYVRCQDANKNSNPANFLIQFTVEDGPDTTPPLIVSTSTINGAPIAYNQTQHDIIVYTNEPANCKWSHLNEEFEEMDDIMTCSNSVKDINAQMLYECKTTLSGLKNNENNEFYFRCQDQAEIPNTNQESYKFVLVGTRPLVLNSMEPKQGEIVKEASDPVKVVLKLTTSAGYKEGESNCYYSTTGEANDELEFFNTFSYEHSQDLWLPEGAYTYHFRCIDLGGNAISNITSFNVESDSEPPVVIRAYHEESYLKIVTDEQASCVYDTVNCDYNFEEGTPMATLEEVNHFTDWVTSKSFYIKCKDKYDRGPEPNNVCSLIVRPASVAE